MKQFAQDLKERNDNLGKSLGVKKIEVEDDSWPQKVFVKVEMLGPHGPILVPTYMVKMYEALGLSIRGKEQV